MSLHVIYVDIFTAGQGCFERRGGGMYSRCPRHGRPTIREHVQAHVLQGTVNCALSIVLYIHALRFCAVEDCRYIVRLD